MSAANPKYLKFLALMRAAKPESDTRPATVAPSIQNGKKKSTGESCGIGSGGELGSIEAAAMAGDWQSVDRRQRQRNAEEKKKRQDQFIAAKAAEEGEEDGEEEEHGEEDGEEGGEEESSDVDSEGNVKGLLANEDSEDEESDSDEEDAKSEWVKEIVKAEVKAKTKRFKQRIEALERCVKMLKGGGGATSESGEGGTDAGPKRRRLRNGGRVIEDEE